MQVQQLKGHQGHNGIFGPLAACVQFMFDKTSLPLVFCIFVLLLPEGELRCSEPASLTHLSRGSMLK